MEESKKRAQVGTKVSKIANIFQGMPSRDEDDMRGSDVTVVRTESHLARFNNARALFEKLGEENRAFRIEKSPSAAASFAGTRGFPPAVPARSRSSSAGSVSPPRRTITPPASASAINGGDRLSNGASQPPPKPAKPVVLPKPDKPDRRFNKELIEKQRNWTAHFNKTKSSRHDHEHKVESKHYIGYHDRKSPEVAERYVVPSRVYSPPLSPCAGDSQVERPSTLPSTFISRCTPGTKSPSPIKTVPSVTPTRSNNLVSPARSEAVTRPQSSPIRRDKISSPTNTSDDRFFPRPGSANRVFPRSRSIVSPEKEDEKDDYPEKDGLLSPNKTDSSVVTKPYELVSSPLPSYAEPVIEPVSLPRHQKSPPTPIPRSPRTPPPIAQEENNVSADCGGQPSMQKDHSSPLQNKTIDCPPSDDKSEAKKESQPPSPRPLPAIPTSVNDHWSQIEDEISNSPEPYEIVMSSPNPVTASEDDGYEPVHFASDVEEKSKRRSSTPESPEGGPMAEEAPRSPLASPLASPVHHLSSSSPAAASPSPGKC